MPVIRPAYHVCSKLCGSNFYSCIPPITQVYNLQIKAKTEDVASINVVAVNFVGLTVDAGGTSKNPLLDPVGISARIFATVRFHICVW